MYRGFGRASVNADSVNDDDDDSSSARSSFQSVHHTVEDPVMERSLVSALSARTGDPATNAHRWDSIWDLPFPQWLVSHRPLVVRVKESTARREAMRGPLPPCDVPLSHEPHLPWVFMGTALSSHCFPFVRLLPFSLAVEA